MEENIRFIAVLDELKIQGLTTGYVAIAEQLGTNKAAISDIKSCRKKLSLDLLRSLKLSYPQVNLNWIIMGSDDMFITENNSSSTLANSYNHSSLMEFANIIQQQAEEIGRLKAEYAELKRHAERLAANVNTDSIAHVG